MASSSASGVFRRSESAATRAEMASLLHNAAGEEDDESTSVFPSPSRKVKAEHELRPPVATTAGGNVGRGAAGSSLGEALNLIEMEVQPGATLASIALKYNIPVAELKRVNNLLADNELFALKRLKIPVRPNSVLTEILIPGLGEDGGGGGAGAPQAAEKNTNGWLLQHFSTPPESSQVSSPVMSDTSDMSLGAALRDVGADDVGAIAVPPPTLVHGNNSGSKQARKARRFLRAMDKDLAVIRQKNERLLNASGVPADISDLDLDQVAGESGGSGMKVLAKTSVIVFLVVLAAVILAILWFARHEFNIIKVEKPTNLTE